MKKSQKTKHSSRVSLSFSVTFATSARGWGTLSTDYTGRRLPRPMTPYDIVTTCSIVDHLHSRQTPTSLLRDLVHFGYVDLWVFGVLIIWV